MFVEMKTERKDARMLNDTCGCDAEDPLAAARGILNGLLIGFLMWTALCFAVVIALKRW